MLRFKFIKTNLFFLILICLISLFLYGKSIFFDFTECDDTLLIKDKFSYISNIINIPKFFTTSCYYNNDNAYYRPVLTLSFSIESILFGLNTRVYHTTNIILFILALYLMYLFLVKLNFNINLLKFVFLLLVVHPIFVSTVCWVPARNDTLLVIFIMLSFIFFINYIENNKNKDLLFFNLLFFCALFTKETTIIVAPLYFLLAYSFNCTIRYKQIKKILLGMFFILIVYFVLRNFAVPNKTSIMFIITNYKECFINICLGLINYIEKIIVPIDVPVMQYKISINFNIIFLICIIIFVVSFFYNKLLNKKTIFFGFCWFVLCLLPTFLIKEYTWIPSRIILSFFGLLIIFVSILDVIIIKHNVIKKYLIVLYFILFCIGFYITYNKENNFRNSLTYSLCLYEESPQYHSVCYGLATQYLKIGDFDKYKNMLYKAYELSGDDRYILDRINILFYEKRIEEAEQLALTLLNTNDLSSFHKLGALKVLSKIYFYKKEINKSIYFLQQYYSIEQTDIEVIQMLAQCYAIIDKYNEAVSLLLENENVNKNNDVFYFLLANLYEDLKDFVNAKKYIEKAKVLNNSNDTYKNKLEEYNNKINNK